MYMDGNGMNLNTLAKLVLDRYMFKMDKPIETGCEMGKKRGLKRGPNSFRP
jgi:hypothetical protein